MNKVSAIDDQIKSIATGSPVYIEVKAGVSAPDAREKGTLKSVDWSKRTLVLRHEVYEDDRTIHFDKITLIQSQIPGRLTTSETTFGIDSDSMPPPPFDWEE